MHETDAALEGPGLSPASPSAVTAAPPSQALRVSGRSNIREASRRQHCHDGDGENAGRGATGVWIEDVVASRICGRGRDREIVRLEHGRDLVACERMLDADPPGRTGDPHVTARAHGKVIEPRVLQQLRY